MGPSRLTLCLVVLTVLESASVEAIDEFFGANVARRHWRKIGAVDESIGSPTIADRGMEHYRDIVRGYLEVRADESPRKGVGTIGRKSRSLVGGDDESRGIPYSARRWQKMLDKAIFKIIMGDLSTADILLLKSLNYNLEEVLAIREREYAKKIGVSERAIGTIGSIGREKTIDVVSSTLTHGSNYLDDNVERLANGDSVPSVATASSTGGKNYRHDKTDDDFDFEAYNRQAIYDYENTANNISQRSELDQSATIVDRPGAPADNDEIVEPDDDLRRNFDRAMESHVVFKIRYDDSEFDSRSDERSRQLSRERAIGSVRRSYDRAVKSRDGASSRTTERSAIVAQPATNAAEENRRNDTLLESTVDMRYSMPLLYRLSNLIAPTVAADETTIGDYPIVGDRNDSTSAMRPPPMETVNANSSEFDERMENRSANNDLSDGIARMNVYEGLEWVEDDVYRVVPEADDSIDYDGNAIYLDKAAIDDDDDDVGNETRGIGVDTRNTDDDDDNRNDTSNYQNEDSDDFAQQQSSSSNSSARNQSSADLSAYRQIAIAHRRDQGQKAIEDIKLKVLAMTGRFNLSSSNNQVQRERLTLFSPICQVPRNTDPEAWSDPFSMNMYFQLNLTSGDHVVAAKLRIYKLPQNNVTLPNSAVAEEEDEEEKKIRISVYFYTKSLKKHRSKKRLMDSVVTALTTAGNHLALDVRQAIRFWRQNLRNSHGSTSNHGLVIQVEDQDGRPLKPSQYIERDTCHDTERTEDDKINESLHSSFKPVLVTFVS